MATVSAVAMLHEPTALYSSGIGELMHDLTKTFWDGGQLRGLKHSAICVPDESSFCTELVTFQDECFEADGTFRPEMLVWLRALASEGEIPLPFGGDA